MPPARPSSFLAALVLVACQRPAAQPSSATATHAAPVALAPAGYGPAFRVKGLVPVPQGAEWPLGASWSGKLVLSGARDRAAPNDLWVTDGTNLGTQRLRVGLTALVGRVPGESGFAAFQGALYFAGSEVRVDGDGAWHWDSGVELWRTDGTPEGTRMVADIRPGAGSAYPNDLTVARGALYFVASYGATADQRVRRGLFRTDGTAAGTQLLAWLWDTTDAFYPGGSAQLTAAGGELFLTRAVAGRGVELHRVVPCGAPAGECVELVRDLGWPDTTTQGSWPEMLVALGDRLLFAANGVDGKGIYASDGTAAGTGLVAPLDYVPSLNTERHSAAAGGRAYFLDYLGASLLRTDGTAAGTAALGSGHVDWQFWMPGSGDVIYFSGSDLIDAPTPYRTNHELWRTDGTVAGTHPLLDVCPGSCSSWTTFPPLVTEPEGRLFFTARTDGTRSAAQLWTSDGTETGTLAVQDFSAFGPGWPSRLTRAGDLVFFALGSELWAVRIDLADRAPPELSCPSDLAAEATSASGAEVTYSVAARDNLTPGVQPAVSHDPGPFPLGVTPVAVSVSDAAGNTAQCTFTVTVRDETPPTVSCPPSMAVEALSSAGTPVSYAVAAADVVSAPAVEAVPASGSTFPLGSTAVTATARDAAGNLASCGFTVTVADGTAPALSCPPDQALELAAPEGAPGIWPDALALDVVSAAGVAYEPERGSILAPGSHAVVATATDAGGNRSSCAFTVTVRDTMAPAVTCPADVQQVTVDAGGATVSFPAPKATDAGTAAPETTLSHASGSRFPVGTTTVEFAARDAAGNRSACSFQVTVQSPPAPVPEADPTGVATGPGSGCSAGAGGPLSLLLLAALRLRRGSWNRASARGRGSRRCSPAGGGSPST